MRRVLYLAIATLVLVTGCARSQPAATSSPTPSPTLRPGASPTPAPSSIAEALPCVAQESGPNANISIRDFRFQPDCVIMTSNQGFTISNRGSVLHNFSIEHTSLSIDIQVGQQANTEASKLPPNTYTFFCKYHRSRGMEGELRVRAG